MRKLSLFLAVILCLGLFTALPASAANITFSSEQVTEPSLIANVNAVEGFSNYSFESALSDSNWKSIANSVDTVARTDEVFKNGNYALKLVNGTNTESPKFGAHNNVKIKAGYTYELSAWVKTENITTGSAYLHGIFYGYDENRTQLTYSRMNFYFTSTTERNFDWKKKILRFTAPVGVESITIYAYSTAKEGTVYFDDISLLIPKEAAPGLDCDEPKPAVSDSYLLRDNYETLAVGTYIPATVSGATLGYGGHHTQVSDAYANEATGSTKALKMQVGSNPSQSGFTMANLYKHAFSNLVPGATYQISANILTPSFGTSGDFSYWIRLQDRNGNTDQKKHHYSVKHYPWWRTICFEFVMPENIASVTFEIRYQAASTYELYLDDLSVYMVEEPPYAILDTDELFYYSEWETGVLTANANPYYGDALENGKAVYSFLDQDKTTVLHTTEGYFTNGISSYTFQTNLMEELGKEYFVDVKLYNAQDQLLEDSVLSVYRFNRPTYLGADGIFRKGGKEINIVLGNGVNSDRLNKNPQNGGVTVVQIVADPAYMGTSLRDRMDLAYEKGLFCLINFYADYVCGGNESSIESTLNTVAWAKDHPALFGYKIQDEPYQKGNTDEEMTRAYVGIRNIDPDHPIYLDDSVEGGYDWLYRFADIIDIDYYGGNSNDSGKIFTDKMEKAAIATKGRKPFTLLQQAFQYNGYLPTVDELRNFAYQAFFAGASGIGYHSLGVDGSDGVNAAYIDSAHWAEIVERWAPFEQGFLFDAFVNDKYTLLDSHRDDHVMWKTFRDGKNIYAVVFNREKSVSSAANIALNLDVPEYKATRLAGAVADTTTQILGENALSLTLSPLAAEIWKISPVTSLVDNSEFEVPFTGAPADSWSTVLHHSTAGTLGTASSVSSAVVGETTILPATEDSTNFLKLERHNGPDGDLSNLINRASFIYTKLDSSILEIGKSYRLEYYVNIPAGALSEGVKARVNFQNGAQGHLGVWRDHNWFAVDEYNTAMTSTNGWEKKTLDFVYDGSEIQLNIGLYGAADVGTVFVDELRVYPYTPDTLIVQKQDFELVNTSEVNTSSKGYITRNTRGSVSVEADPKGGTNKVLKVHATATNLPVASVLKMNGADSTLAVQSFTDKDTLKVSFRLYVPTQSYVSGDATKATNVDGYSFGLYYKDIVADPSSSTSGLVRPTITFSGTDVDRWIQVEAYLKANCTTQPRIWFYQGQQLYDFYVDDIKIEKINKAGYISDMVITHYNASACTTSADTDQNWGYIIAGSYNGTVKTTDTIRPLIAYSSADTTKKARAMAILYKIEDGAEMIVDMKMQLLGRVNITELTGAYVNETGIASEGLMMNLSAMDLSAGDYRVDYLLWDANGVTPLCDSVYRTISYASAQN